MKISVSGSLSKRKAADLLVLPYYADKKKVEPAADFTPEFEKAVVEDFSGKQGETLFLYPPEGKEKRILLLGLGEEKSLTIEGIRRAYAAFVNACRGKEIGSVNIIIPESKDINREDSVKGLAEGLFLANYTFDKNKSAPKKGKSNVFMKELTIVNGSKKDLSVIKDAEKLCGSVNFVRDLVNDNADVVTPQFLCHVARTMAKKYAKVTTTLFNKKRIEKEKMGLLLAVNRGSDNDPAFIIVKYNGNPRSKEHTVLVGKGITYDTGGLNLKRTGSMETMRCDMAGAATVLGAIDALAALGVKANVTAVIASTENGIDANSYKPGDVYTGYAGKSVEIANTDAEGRLVLSEALAYSVKNLKPSRIIDVATLTGAVIMALGSVATGLMSTDNDLAEKLQEAAERTSERVWRLPLYEEYRSALNSDIADIKNAGSGGAGASIAGMFLKEFVGDTPWAHLDIAGTSFLKEASYYNPKYGTGAGVRLLVDFIATC